jgi:hypothetical protein
VQIERLPDETVEAFEQRAHDLAIAAEAHFVRAFERPARRAVFQAPEDYSRMMQTAALQRVREVVRTMRPPMHAPHAGF